MDYLVTGGFGFVGSAVVTALLKAGRTVRVFDLPNHPCRHAFEQHWGQFGRPQIMIGDIGDKVAVNLAVQGCKRIVHAAALLNSIAPLAQFHKVNVQGTQNLCEAAIVHQVQRVVLISTSDVFGIPLMGETITENSPLQPWGEPYADTKIEAAKLARQLRDTQGLPLTIIYPGWVYGPGDRQFFPAVLEMIKDRHVFTWHRRNPYEINLIHIDDLVDAVLRSLALGKGKKGEYLILNTHTFMTPARLFSLMADSVGQPIRVHYVPYPLMMLIARCSQWLARKNLIPKHLLSTTDVKAFGNEFHFSTEAATRELGWKAAMPVEQGIEQALAWQHKRRTNPDLVG